MHTAAVLWLLTACAPLTQGIGFKPVFKELNSEIWSESQTERTGTQASKTRTMSAQALQYFREIENASSKRPLLLMNLKGGEVLSAGGDFMPSEEFLASGEEQRQKQGQGAGPPWGISNPGTANLNVFEGSGMPTLNFPTSGIEYSLEAGANIQSFSVNKQDLKIICQVLSNVTNGFYLDSNGGDGERPSNTLLLEHTGWRGLILQPMIYTYADLWSKMRKAWLFLGCLSPHENATKVGFDWYGNIDDGSGHRIHAYPIGTFLAEMGGLNTVDFWNLDAGNYEAEILNETLLGSGSNVEFGVVHVTFGARSGDLGTGAWVQPRSYDDTRDLIWEIFGNAGFTEIGGLGAYLTDDVTPAYSYGSWVFVNPAYFTSRNLYVPTSVSAAPPPQTSTLQTGPNWDSFWNSWDEGLTHDQEVDCIVDYISRARVAAEASEQTPFAHRIDPSHRGLQPGETKYNPIPGYNPTMPPLIRKKMD